VRLGIFEPASSDESRERRERLAEGEQLQVQLMGRTIPVVRTPEGLRALAKGEPLKPRSIEQYLINRFGQHLSAVRAVMEELARSLPPGELAKQVFPLYEPFRPAVPAGGASWGAAGVLELGKIMALIAT
jgi:hypothetical protein